MARNGREPWSRVLRFPHLRGDGPWDTDAKVAGKWISPPAWGWPVETKSADLDDEDFPTCVGMARLSVERAIELVRFPHLRGDGPNTELR